ncbi:MAG: SDR family NAD(P)-dependent oxidoreductase [Bacteroidales bacterium]|nr:SDR family NAD(P)-dependent oxidoreductase [Bacteroidales bacterium]
MQKSFSFNKEILITGGTSGLGLELVKIFLSKGFFVVATGRQLLNLPGYEDRFKLYRIDFSDLKQTMSSLRNICEAHDLSYVVNNAGILSPPDFTSTNDGFEYTFQVNFLSQLLVNEIILQNLTHSKPIKIAAITSPVYKLSKIRLSDHQSKKGYRPLKAYSDSKLFLALMCRYLSAKYQDLNLSCFSFDPGVFSSGISRMQHNWFRKMYGIAAPYMRKPERVAAILAELLISYDICNGAIYNIRKKARHISVTEPSVYDLFWKDIYDKINTYLK